jgi:hypothetical protein
MRNNQFLIANARPLTLGVTFAALILGRAVRADAQANYSGAVLYPLAFPMAPLGNATSTIAGQAFGGTASSILQGMNRSMRCSGQHRRGHAST